LNIAEYSVRRPITVTIVVAACLLFGFLSLGRIGLDLLPQMDLPMAVVVTVYPNADPETIDSLITVPVERSLKSARNIKSVTSTSMENVSVSLAEFNWGSDLGSVQEEIRAGMDRIRYQLPEGVQDPIVSLIDPSQLPLMMLTVGAQGDLGDVTRVAREIVKPEIERVDGVAGVSISGGADRVISVEYDHEKLAEAGLSPLLLQQLISLQNLSVPAGVVVDDGVRYQTRVGAKFQSAEEIASLTIGMNTKRSESVSGQPRLGGLMGLSFLMPSFLTTVGDIATVEEKFQKTEGYARVDGNSSVMLLVYKQSGQNTVTTARRVNQALDRLTAGRSDISVAHVFDQSTYITRSINGLRDNLIIGAVLAVVVLFVFLRHLGSTLVVAVSIPLSVVFAFVLMYAWKLSINLMTLGGLALGVGMLVDNSIVVLESIYRRQELGDPPLTAAVNGTREVGTAIISSTMTTVAVFVPVVFIEGMVGTIFRDLAMTVTFSLLASLAVALTVVPLLASGLVRLRGKAAPKDSVSAPGRLGARNRQTLISRYDQALTWAMRNRWAVLAAVVAAVVAAVAVYPSLGVELFKNMDMARIDVSLHMPAGTPTDVTNQVSMLLEAKLMEMPGLGHVTAEVGSTGGDDFLAMAGNAGSNSAAISIALRREGPVQTSVAEAADFIRAAVAQTQQEYPELECTVDTSGYGSLTGGQINLFGGKVSLEILGSDSRELAEYSSRVAQRLREAPEFVEVSSSAQDLQPVILLSVNPTRALMGSMTVGQVGLGVRTAMLGTTVTYVERRGELIPVVVRPASDGVPTLESVLDMPISSSLGTSSIMQGASQMGSNASAAARASGTGASSLLAPPTEVLVGRVATPQVIEGPMTIFRRNGRQYVKIDIAFRGMKLSQAGDLALAAAREVEAPADVDLALGGATRAIDEAMSELTLALCLAAVLVYMVMAVQYESLLYPLIIMFTMPLAAIGAIALLAMAGESISVTAIIGLIVLAGVVVNNGIVMVDFINQLKATGMKTPEAVRKASLARLRPILMTALTTILGLLPLAIGRGAGSELERPLALTVIGGLTTATFLTLFVIPIIYELMDEAGHRLSHRGVH